jgi:peptidoglycan/LPS O-acetylase OafA/YrhL
VRDQGRSRYDRSWKLAASLLGIVALVVASVAVNLVELEAPWELVVCFAVMGVVLLGGTLWLVPSRRADHS